MMGQNMPFDLRNKCILTYVSLAAKFKLQLLGLFPRIALPPKSGFEPEIFCPRENEDWAHQLESSFIFLCLKRK